MPKLILTMAICTLVMSLTLAQPSVKMTRQDYIEKYKEIAIKEMHDFKIPASITLAQGVLESGDGNSELAVHANNHFGIKCHKGWEGRTYHMDDDAKNECFRKYSDPYDSYKDHSFFLTSRDRYNGLFELEITDYKGWAHGLKKAGYATNPKYAQLLIKIIEENNLHQFDKYYDPDYVTEKIPAIASKEKPYYNHNIEPLAKSESFVGGNNRQVYENNGVKFIFAKKGDSFEAIANDFNIYTYQVPKYNELKKKHRIKEGELLYLEKKKGSHDKGFHVVEKGETLHDIAQKYGIRLKALRNMNYLKKKDRVQEGRSLLLHRKGKRK